MHAKTLHAHICRGLAAIKNILEAQ